MPDRAQRKVSYKMIDGAFCIMDDPDRKAPSTPQCMGCYVALTVEIARLGIRVKKLAVLNEELTYQLKRKETTGIYRAITSLLVLISIFAYCGDAVDDVPRRIPRRRREGEIECL